jgi:hypothetical protein
MKVISTEEIRRIGKEGSPEDRFAAMLDIVDQEEARLTAEGRLDNLKPHNHNEVVMKQALSFLQLNYGFEKPNDELIESALQRLAGAKQCIMLGVAYDAVEALAEQAVQSILGEAMTSTIAGGVISDGSVDEIERFFAANSGSNLVH